jgi:hypothetical protein
LQQYPASITQMTGNPGGRRRYARYGKTIVVQRATLPRHMGSWLIVSVVQEKVWIDLTMISQRMSASAEAGSARDSDTDF